MTVTLLAFASAAQQLGWREREVPAEASDTPRALFARADADFQPGAARVAVNGEYHEWDVPVGDGAEEIAVIPPVSGG